VGRQLGWSYNTCSGLREARLKGTWSVGVVEEVGFAIVKRGGLHKGVGRENLEQKT
jgi:hypothetical protein